MLKKVFKTLIYKLFEVANPKINFLNKLKQATTGRSLIAMGAPLGKVYWGRHILMCKENTNEVCGQKLVIKTVTLFEKRNQEYLQTTWVFEREENAKQFFEIAKVKVSIDQNGYLSLRAETNTIGLDFILRIFLNFGYFTGTLIINSRLARNQKYFMPITDEDLFNERLYYCDMLPGENAVYEFQCGNHSPVPVEAQVISFRKEM